MSVLVFYKLNAELFLKAQQSFQWKMMTDPAYGTQMTV